MTIAHIIAGKGSMVVTAAPHHTLEEIARLLNEKRIGAVVVSSGDGRVEGIISERDIVRAVARLGAQALQAPASVHMTSKVVTTSESATVLATLEQMTGGRFRHVPVVRDGRLVAIVSIGDLVKYRLAQMEQDQSAMRDYIMTA